MGANCEGFSKRETCTQCRLFSPTFQPNLWSGRAQHRGRRIDYVAVSGDWRDDSEKPMTLPAIKLPGESIDHVPVRASMLWPHFSSSEKNSVSKTNDTPVLDPWLLNNPDARRLLQHHTSACIPELLSLAQRGVVGGMHSTAHSTLRWCSSFCFGELPSRRNLDESTDCCNECVHGAYQTPVAQTRKDLSWQTRSASCLPGETFLVKLLGKSTGINEVKRFLQRGTEAFALLTMRIQRTAMKRAITNDLFRTWLCETSRRGN